MLPEINKITYATDLSSGSSHVFRYALSLASKYQAQVTILHVVEPLSNFAQSLVELHIGHEHSEQMHTETRAKLKEQIKLRLNSFCDREQCHGEDGRNLVSGIKVTEGQPAESILKLSGKLDADLIILGSHRHTVLGETLIGSTASKVLHKATSPVLLVRIPSDYHEEDF